tara:strand:- start:935 stop:1789 length:855 start_codon:yes stop_codon:yes gene_type:complete
MKDDNKVDYGKGKTPGHFCVLPQRAIVDPRFKDHPSVFRVLAALGNYTSRQGVCWPNQSTIARDLHLCQSTVSRHIKRLIQWDYIRYAKKHPGLKGNKYFMVFDPEIVEADAAAIATVQDRSFEEKPEIPSGPLNDSKAKVKKTPTKQSNKPIENKEVMHPNAYSDMHPEYIHNNITNNDIYTIGRNLLNKFVRLSEEIYGQVRVYDEKHIKIVAGWLEQGLDPEYAVKRMKHVMIWRRNNNLDSPKSVVFFKDALFKQNKNDKAQRAEAMLKKLGRGLKRIKR